MGCVALMKHVFLTSLVEKGRFLDLTKCKISVMLGWHSAVWTSVRLLVGIEAVKVWREVFARSVFCCVAE